MSAQTDLTPDLERIRDQIAPVLARYNVQKAIVFGSFARGEPSPRSDLDLLLIQNTDKRFFDRYQGLFTDLMLAVQPHREIDLLIYTAAELERMRHRSFVATILREGRVIYESE